MSCLVVGNGLLLCGSNYSSLTLESSYDPVDRIEEILPVNLLLISSCSRKCSLVTNIRDVGSGETRSMFGHEFHIEISGNLESLYMDIENLHSFLEFRKIHMNLSVETAGTHKRLVQNVRTVCRCENDYTGVGIETIHLSKELVQCIFTFIVR